MALIEERSPKGRPQSLVNVAMPELSHFYGIIIRMYCELGPHRLRIAFRDGMVREIDFSAGPGRIAVWSSP